MIESASMSLPIIILVVVLVFLIRGAFSVFVHSAGVRAKKRSATDHSEPQAADDSEPQPTSCQDPQPAKPRVNITFRLSDLKTNVPCGPLDQRADPMVEGNYERYERFFADETGSSLGRPQPTVQTLPSSGDHMRSPLLKPTGDVVSDEQTAMCEIMRYLWGNRQALVHTGKEMAPLDIQSSVRAAAVGLVYTYDSYTATTEGCYDSGTFELSTKQDKNCEILVQTLSESEYVRRREEACAEGKTYVDGRKLFEYDGDLALEGETEAFMGDSRTLYLYRPFGMKECLKIMNYEISLY